ncbi:MAG: PD-(D/E)XK nuclease family protein, partial [Propionibacteriaceae bacterium]|nr:PD-(D/E)XK nuclease family protein [Propionibacteriaceae bacterium]
YTTLFPISNDQAQAQAIAHQLRLSHLLDGRAFTDMAVVVRSKDQLAPIDLACRQAGVPVVRAGDDIQLRDEPTVASLLAAARLADGASVNLTDWPDVIASPLASGWSGKEGCLIGTADESIAGDALSHDSRNLWPAVQAIAAQVRRQVPSSDQPPTSMSESEVNFEASACAVDDRSGWTVTSSVDQSMVDGLVHCLGAGRRAAATGSVVDVLWAIWDSSGWEDRLVSWSEQGGEVAIDANRQLDAVIALFRLAEQFRAVDATAGIRSLSQAVAAADLPDDLPASSVGLVPAVRLATAHRVRGQSWPMVVVAGVNDDSWPAPAPRASMIDLEGIDERIVAPDRRLHQQGETRLLALACAAAEEELWVTAVDGDDCSVSPLFERLAIPEEHDAPQDAIPAWSVEQMLGNWRMTLADEGAHPGLRQAASDRLAQANQWLSPNWAQPASWWFVGAGQDAPAPRSAVSIAASGVDELLVCPRRWFLSSQAKGQLPNPTPARLGSLVHRLVQDDPGDLPGLEEALKQYWSSDGFAAPWLERSQYRSTQAMLARYDQWRAASDWTTVANEVELHYRFDLDGPVELRGRIDRLTRDPQGRIWVIDFKTGRTAPSLAQVAANAQLGLYQWAIAQGALAMCLEPTDILGGAQLIYLGMSAGAKAPALPKVLTQASLLTHPTLPPSSRLSDLSKSSLVSSAQAVGAFPCWLDQILVAVVARLHSGHYPAAPSGLCSRCPFRLGCPSSSTDDGEQ